MKEHCPVCKEEYISAEALLAETAPLGPNHICEDASKSIVRTYTTTGVYYYHASEKSCVKETAKVVELEEPILRTLREAVHKK